MDIGFSPEETRFREQCRDWLHDNVPKEKRPLHAADAIGFDKAWQRQLFDSRLGGDQLARPTMAGAGCRSSSRSSGWRNMQRRTGRGSARTSSASITAARR
ncbi:hypothetical protein [Sphingopyxis sp. PET50]|uniref:hypothetical protein n=1 Tax=Sphingopyxis sp. PET50 TaxID=2976533 RepID=UPI0021AFFAB0|nr:hypothetical protein [Sphingopyxis sp. PET50]